MSEEAAAALVERRRGGVVAVCHGADHRGHSAHLPEVCGATVSKDTVSRIMERVIEEMQSWSARPLERVYAAIFTDAIMVKVRDGQVGNPPSMRRSGSTLRATRTSWACGPVMVTGNQRSLDGGAHRTEETAASLIHSSWSAKRAAAVRGRDRKWSRA